MYWVGVIKKEEEREQEAKREGGGESQKSKRGFKLEEVEIKREEAGIGTDAGPIYNRTGKVGK